MKTYPQDFEEQVTREVLEGSHNAEVYDAFLNSHDFQDLCARLWIKKLNDDSLDRFDRIEEGRG